MKLRLSSAVLLSALATSAFATTTTVEPITATPSSKFYIGIFGGAGTSNNFNANQFGTVYLLESQGGPLAVNAGGQLSDQSATYLGAQIGYQAADLALNPSTLWTLAPGAELEAFTMSNSTFSGNLINNNNTRLAEQNFAASYPMSRTVFLANAVLTFNNPRFVLHPYIGLGIGDAIIRISSATATQVNPPEPGFNHYNGNSSDTSSTFAGQVKLGVSYDVNKYISVFADYRWLYLASTQFTFGSGMMAGHAETTSWQVNTDAQRYNMGNIGVRVNI